MTAQETTARPCPYWCELPAGHDFDSLTLDGRRASRPHTIDVGGETGWSNLERSKPSDVWVDLIAREEVDDVDLCSNPSVTGVLLQLQSEGCYLDSARARAVAAFLLAGADQLDAITGATL